MTTFSRSPKMLKGALAVYPSQTPGTRPSNIVAFQYNSEHIRRTLADRTPAHPKGTTTGAARDDVLRVPGPPIETINVTIELDAADQLEHPDDNIVVAQYGLHPALATLEMLMYPPSLNAQRIEAMAKQGAVQISLAELPVVLLVWGQSRVVPVHITSFSVTESVFDTQLNPIQATVELGLRVLTYVDLPQSSIGRDSFISYQKEKERLAALSSSNSAQTQQLSNLLPGAAQSQH